MRMKRMEESSIRDVESCWGWCCFCCRGETEMSYEWNNIFQPSSDQIKSKIHPTNSVECSWEMKTQWIEWNQHNVLLAFHSSRETSRGKGTMLLGSKASLSNLAAFIINMIIATMLMRRFFGTDQRTASVRVHCHRFPFTCWNQLNLITPSGQHGLTDGPIALQGMLILF